MKTRYLIILAAILLVCTGIVLAATNLAKGTGELTSARWEYGVFRIGGQYQYEWQDAKGRTYASSKIAFLEKMGLISIIKKLETMTDAPHWALQYTLEIEFLNHLGKQGWQLVFVVDKGPAGIPNRTFWFKRPN